MNIFPTITNLDEFKANVGEIPGIEFKTNEDGYTVASYYILDSKVFDNPYARECRGITFDKHGKLVSRPFHKFFNLGEKEATLEQNLDWSSVECVMDKRDGSMISPVLFDDGTIRFKTKRTYTSDEAIHANENFGPDSPQYKLSKYLCELNCTPIFELTSPANRIVVAYKETSLTLLAIRNNEDGQYWSRGQLEALAMEWRVPVVELNLWTNIADYKDKMNTLTAFEGFVIQFLNGEMIKCVLNLKMEHGLILMLISLQTITVLIKNMVNGHSQFSQQVFQFKVLLKPPIFLMIVVVGKMLLNV